MKTVRDAQTQRFSLRRRVPMDRHPHSCEERGVLYTVYVRMKSPEFINTFETCQTSNICKREQKSRNSTYSGVKSKLNARVLTTIYTYIKQSHALLCIVYSESVLDSQS